MDQADGEAILALPEGERTIRFGRTPVENPSIQMAQFSSWGSTPDLRLKPEIAAPGSAIYSLQNDNGYTSMSGTSMSSPHVAGAAAVVRDYMSKNEPFKSMSEGEKARLSKVLLMNSAYVMTNDLIARSPRVQGAGMMDLKNMIVLMQRGKASTSANSLKSAHLPSITGIPASGPISPRPKIAVPSVITATSLERRVSS